MRLKVEAKLVDLGKNLLLLPPPDGVMGSSSSGEKSRSMISALLY
ncbi:MAG TPA: hypothetical protein V6D28_14470 [Leptolyngbyaceae cyanobacterium]